MEVIIEKLIYERAPWIFSKNIFIKALKPLIYKILNYEKTLNIANNIKDLNCDKLFNYLCDLLAKNVKITGLSNIPKTGSAIIICNHPTGIADGIMIYHSINKIRPDLFFYANVDAIRIFPQLSNIIAPIQWRARKRTLTSSRETLKFTKEAFKNQRLAIIFPSGRLAKRKRLSLIERKWMPSAISLARKYNLPIIPVHINARNSLLFYFLDLISQSLKDITLFYEVLNKKDYNFRIKIGRSINTQDLPHENEDATLFVKERVLSLGKFKRFHVLSSPFIDILKPILFSK